MNELNTSSRAVLQLYGLIALTLTAIGANAASQMLQAGHVRPQAQQARRPKHTSHKTKRRHQATRG